MRLNLIGKRFERLLVIYPSLFRRGYKTYWICQCDCGHIIRTRTTNLQSGNTKSCGCIYMELTFEKGKNNSTHKMSKKSIYHIWSGMIQRCNNPKNTIYKYYGARGIKVCDRWLVFENFYKDMGDRPPNLSIDRKNNNGNYEPSNCRWATMKEQNNNRRDNI